MDVSIGGPIDSIDVLDLDDMQKGTVLIRRVQVAGYLSDQSPSINNEVLRYRVCSTLYPIPAYLRTFPLRKDLLSSPILEGTRCQLVIYGCVIHGCRQTTHTRLQGINTCSSPLLFLFLFFLLQLSSCPLESPPTAPTTIYLAPMESVLRVSLFCPLTEL